MTGSLRTRTATLSAAALSLLLAGSALAKAEKVTVKYTVKKGDTLSGISERFGVSVGDILEWNDHIEKKTSHIDEDDVEGAALNLRPGMTLKLPGKPTGKGGTLTYKVKKGDSLWSIAKQFHVKQSLILKWNEDELGTTGTTGKAGKGGPAKVSVEEAAGNLVTGMVLRVPGKPSGSAKKVISHKVQKGESLWSIGKKYNVKPATLVKWNPKLGGEDDSGGKGDEGGATPVIHPGMELLIHALRPDLGERVAVLRVGKGETAKKIASRYDVDYKLLLAANFILPTDKLDLDQIVEVPIAITKNDTQSIGSPTSGKLVAGEPMPSGPGWIVKQPQYAYGTSEMISGIIGCIASVQREFKDTPDMVVGHLSRKFGGKFKPHKSHASGRDADMGYYLTGPATKQFVKVDGNLDVKRTSRFIECLVESGDVQYIFINTYIQKVLYESFQNRGYGADFLTRVFQYPHEKGKQLGIIRHENGHDDHMHVRFFCPEGDKQCHD
jgi:LysM repeat protein